MNNPVYGLGLVTASEATMNRPSVVQHPPRRHWLVEIVTDGSFEIRTRSGPWMRIGPRHGLLCPPGIAHRERVPFGVCRSVWAFFDLADGGFARRLAGGETLRRIRDPEDLASICLRELQRLPGLLPEDHLAAHGHLCRLVWLLLCARTTEDELIVRERPSANASLVDRANRFLIRNMHRSVRIADVAAHVGLSLSGLHHAYRRECGTSPMCVLRQVRITKARALLQRGGLNLEAIANETGFADAFHLSRTFKSLTGITPRDFRAGQEHAVQKYS